jgi:pilus assembly protein Flp/PilA
MLVAIRRVLLDESGATVIEYALIAALIAIAIASAVDELGESLSSTFTNVAIAL